MTAHMEDFGGKLRQARERRGISLRQIAASTKISAAALEALERNDISRLPGGIFSRAFVRSYAAEVGLDPDATPLSDVMTSQPQTIHPDEPFVNALRVMHQGRFRHLPVVEFDRPLGMVSVRDALDGDLYALHEVLEQQEDSLY